MTYVAQQIIIWIVLAVLFGFAVGWIARGRRGITVKRTNRRF